MNRFFRCDRGHRYVRVDQVAYVEYVTKDETNDHGQTREYASMWLFDANGAELAAIELGPTGDVGVYLSPDEILRQQEAAELDQREGFSSHDAYRSRRREKAES